MIKLFPIFHSAITLQVAGAAYHGKLIGSFPADSNHEVAGTVYAVDDDTIRIIGFFYDGSAPGIILLRPSDAIILVHCEH